MTPSMDSFMLRTPSSSLRNAASWSMGSGRSCVGVLGGLGVLGVLGREVGGPSSSPGDSQILDSVYSVVSSAIMADSYGIQSSRSRPSLLRIVSVTDYVGSAGLWSQ